MAGGMDLGGGGKGGKKPLDTSINLVPFIDLMAVTIVFLIMTAVWTQLGRLQVSQSGQSAQEEQPQENKPPPPSLLITEKELKLSVGGLQYDPIPVIKDEKGRIELKKLVENLGKVKAEQPDQVSITLQTEDGVLYDDLVRIIDAVIGAQFPSVSVSPASSS
ncbi:MAG: biopolymer transporter ExbD [Archangiaceae bacterium]|nr:biopolymer transporter ExbD [Archangiaceae bacterium]